MPEEKKYEENTLHIPKLRKKWQILCLQLISTVSLLVLLRRMSEIYGPCSEQFIIENSESSWCASYEHTRGLMWLSEKNGLLIPDALVGIGQTGFMSLIGPLILCVAATIAIDRFWSTSQENQRRIQIGLAGTFAVWIFVPFILSWLAGMVNNGLYLPIGNEEDSLNHLDVLFAPLFFLLELLFLGIVFAPIMAGLVGIWGLSKRAIAWSVGYYIIIIAFHAVLTFEPIVSEIDIGLQALPTQIGEGTMFGGLVSEMAWSLIGISVLMLLFMESGMAAVNHLEYAASLPEDTRKNREYIRQFDNIVNSHLIQLTVVISLVLLTTSLALAFDDLLISIVGLLEGTQWTGQVRESLELQMTYGKVISAGLFIIVVAGMRFVVPWQVITGYIESGIAKLRA
ncbi:MAG TPA: hypothetical protein QF703_00900 [Candidatus Thalassarchaeaceae archaeon]|nr:hypothetical protein [Candidatus Thalassarchaeaceae archaeon]